MNNNIKKIYFISGVCGVGKTATLKHLKNILDPDFYDVRDLDERGVPAGGGINWLKNETRHWLDVAKENSEAGRNTIICGFANPELFDEIHKKDSDIPAEIILLNASGETIRSRLLGRHNTPELIKRIEISSGTSLDQFVEGNVNFSTEFKKIFEKKGLPIVETDNLTPEDVSKEVVRIIEG
jgi:deoxyadenosine/deoxycytidine kinase